MSITTYAELQTAVGNWLDDTSLSSRIVEFIALGEDAINDDLPNIAAAWTDTTLTGTTDSRSIALPSGFVEAQALFLTTFSTQGELVPFVNGSFPLRTTSGTPTGWSVNGENIDLDCPCDQAHTFLFKYRAKWDIANDSTNWLLTNHPGIYLAASLVAAFLYRREMEAMAAWQGHYLAGVERVTNRESRTTSRAPLMTDIPNLVRRGGTFNYTTGQ